jgi:hypothetical protein
MSAIQIPTDQVLPLWDQTVTLDGTDFILGFRLNVRENCYYLIIADVFGNVIIGGVKIVCNVLLLQNVVNPAAPAGDFLAQPTGSDAPPGYSELGGRVVLWYVPQADLLTGGFDTNRDPLALLPTSG